MSEFSQPGHNGPGDALGYPYPYMQQVGPPHNRAEYDQAEFLRDYTNALLAYTVPGYPAFQDRLRMYDRDELVDPNGKLNIPYDASQPWCPADFYPTHATKPIREGQFIDDGGVHPPTEQEAALWESLGVQTDQRGMPVHPYAESMILGGYTPEGEFVQPGGVVTPGAYPGRGPRKTADMLLVAEHEDTLHGLFIERKDNGLLALPGGHVDPEDANKSRELDGQLTEYEVAGIRELAEETGIDIEANPDGLSCSGLAVVLNKVWAGVGGDQRTTLHSWPQGEGFAVYLPEIPTQKPRAATDAKKVEWLPLSEDTLTRLSKFSNHGAIGRRAVRVYRDKTGSRIHPDGSIW